jgi:hypothetical protein
MSQLDWERNQEEIRIVNVVLTSSAEIQVKINAGLALAHVIALWVSDSHLGFSND